MASTLPNYGPPCCDPCSDPTVVQVPGPVGEDGIGTIGADGNSAYTNASAQFVMPAELANVVVSVAWTGWMAVGEIVYAAKTDGSVKGYFRVAAIADLVTVTLTNLENSATGAYPDNSAPGAIFPIGSLITPGGLQGPQGTMAGAAGGDLKGTYPNPKISVANTKGSIPIGNGTDTVAYPAATDGFITSYLAANAQGVQSTKLLPLTADANVADNRVPRLDRPAGTEVPSPIQSSLMGLTDNGAFQIGYGNAKGTDAVDLQASHNAVTQVASGNESSITGGRRNTASGTRATIGGGDSNVASGTESTVAGGTTNTAGAGSHAFVGGGDTNVASGQEGVVAGGNHNTASGVQSTVGGGDTNTASGDESVVAGGGRNAASATNAAVGGGDTNGATAQAACIPGGKDGLADKYGQLAHAAGGFGSVPGTAQESVLVMRNSTANATPTELFLDGVSLRAVMASGKSWMFQIMLVARKDDGLTSIYKSEGVITNVGNVVTMPAAATTTEIFDGIGLPPTPVAVTADDPNNALIITCTGVAATNVRWVARVQLVEVIY